MARHKTRYDVTVSSLYVTVKPGETLRCHFNDCFSEEGNEIGLFVSALTSEPPDLDLCPRLFACVWVMNMARRR